MKTYTLILFIKFMSTGMTTTIDGIKTLDECEKSASKIEKQLEPLWRENRNYPMVYDYICLEVK